MTRDTATTREPGAWGPMQGIKVLEFSHVQAGPVCAMMLADMGAEVVKVESFEGDMFRRPMEGANFYNFNRNKRAIALNLKSPEGLEVALKLARQADVIVENFLPGALTKLGLGYDAIREINPAVIYASISGFGQQGPLRNNPAFEPILQAMSGIMEATGEPDRAPARVRPAMIDYSTGAVTAFAVASALFGRERSGRGEYIDVALLDIAMFAMSPYLTHYKRTGETFARSGSAHPATAPNQNFETRDGFICIASAAEHMWRKLCEVLELDEAAVDPKFANQSLRNRNLDELVTVINARTRQFDSAELQKRLLAAGIPCAKVRSIAEIGDEAHVRERGVMESTEHPGVGPLTTLKTPVLLSGRSAPMRRHAPMLGENTRELLSELGYTAQQIETLLTADVARQYHGETEQEPSVAN